MKNFKTLLSLCFLTFITYACEPEELPNDTSQLKTFDNVSAHGNKDDEVETRGED